MNIFLYITVFIATAIGMKIIPIRFHRKIGVVLFTIGIILIGPVVVSKTAEWRVKNIPILSTQQERERVKDMVELRAIIKSIHELYYPQDTQKNSSKDKL